MLNSFSNSKNNILVKIIFGLIALSFLLAGTNALFSPNAEQTIMEINGEQISTKQYQDEYNKNVHMMKLNGQTDIDKNALNSAILRLIINKTLVLQEAKKFGLSISDDSANEITRKRFMNKDTKKFDRNLFDQFMKYNGITESKYINDLKDSMMIRQLTYLVTESVGEVPQSLVKLEYLLDNTKHNIHYLVFNDEDINKNNKTEFTKKLISTDEETLNYYNENKDKLFLEQNLNVSYIIIAKDEKSDVDFHNLLKTIKSQISAGMNVTQIANELDIQFENKDITKINLKNLIKEDDLSFNEDEINIFPGIKPYTRVILQINQISPTEYINLTEARKQITDNILKEKSHNIAKEIIENNKEKILQTLQKEGKIWGKKITKADVSKNSSDKLEFDITSISDMKENNISILSDSENKKHVIILLKSSKMPEQIDEKDLPHYAVIVKDRIQNDLYRRFMLKLISNAKIEYDEKMLRKLGLDINNK